MLHLILIRLVEAASSHTSWQSAAQAVLPVDFIELPAASADSEAAASTVATWDTGSLQPDLPQNLTQTPGVTGVDSAAAVQAAVNDSPDSKSLPSQEVELGQVSFDAASADVEPAATPTEAEVRESPSPSATPAPEAESTSHQFPAIQSAQPQQVEQPESPRLPSPLAPSLEASPFEQQPILSSPAPLATQPIDVPVPDVTETLPPEALEPPETVTEHITIPNELTASLTTAPPETSDPLLDEAAYPKQEVQTFAANSAGSPCLMSPEAVPFLGKTVAMEVMTDESGQVIETVTQESSQSTAYDELATCLVKNWDFEPAIAQGEPIATDGLIVWITIESDEVDG